MFVPACVQPSMSLGTVPSSLDVLLGSVAVPTSGPAGLAVARRRIPAILLAPPNV